MNSLISTLRRTVTSTANRPAAATTSFRSFLLPVVVASPSRSYSATARRCASSTLETLAAEPTASGSSESAPATPARSEVIDKILEQHISAGGGQKRRMNDTSYTNYIAGRATVGSSLEGTRSNRASVPVSTAEFRWRTRCEDNRSGTSYPPPVTTTTARTVVVKNASPAVAVRRLNRILLENNVKREFKRQERFEGRSDKRCRLSSERHRKRFKVAVGKAVSLAVRMK